MQPPIRAQQLQHQASVRAWLPSLTQCLPLPPADCVCINGIISATKAAAHLMKHCESRPGDLPHLDMPTLQLLRQRWPLVVVLATSLRMTPF
jgi:hypothetical protein